MIAKLKAYCGCKQLVIPTIGDPVAGTSYLKMTIEDFINSIREHVYQTGHTVEVRGTLGPNRSEQVKS